MNKVLYNACYGGFNYSAEFQKAYYDLKGIDYTTIVEFGTEYVREKGDSIYDSRHSPELVALVEEWKSTGRNPSGKYSDIEIATIEGNQYLIDEYDGAETVMEPDDYCFITIEEKNNGNT